MLMYSSTLRFLAPFRLVWPSREHISYRAYAVSYTHLTLPTIYSV